MWVFKVFLTVSVSKKSINVNRINRFNEFIQHYPLFIMRKAKIFLLYTKLQRGVF